jgi:hypothetical protein
MDHIDISDLTSGDGENPLMRIAVVLRTAIWKK